MLKVLFQAGEFLLSWNGDYKVEKEKDGKAICPFDPHHNSTAIYVDGELYTGTVADFAGIDPIIYREPLQTEHYVSLNLNEMFEFAAVKQAYEGNGLISSDCSDLPEGYK
ncbi:hypothetical protein RUM43_004231 [Polyplax serrata]|uniref:Sema domain-containing protein n=1 Tax=Polyplax serrata TaxID=468196 RepID=A0AAN8XL56_POLSC